MVWAIRSGARRWQGNFHPTFPEALTQQVLLLLEPSLLLIKQGQSVRLPERARPGLNHEFQKQAPTQLSRAQCQKVRAVHRKVLSKKPTFTGPHRFCPSQGKGNHFVPKGNSVSRRFKEFDIDVKWVSVTKYKKTCILDLALHRSLCATLPLTKCVTLGKLFILSAPPFLYL